jgi:RecG-like helicase
MQDEEILSSQINESISANYKKNWSEKSSTISSRMMELDYVKDILSNAELMEEELMVGETNNIIMPTLFDLLENKKTGVEIYEEYSKLERKAIFDCVRECLELRCRQVFTTRCKAWPRWVESVTMRKMWLAEEVYKDMLEFRSMEEEVVMDEIISKDMSTPLGKWLDFDIEVSENGLELELDIVTYLIDELVSDLWLV